jgi:Cft2 family RNA processing exonuclease
MRASPTVGGICIKEADVVIMDSTYPYPNIKFGDREDVIRTIQYYVRNKLYRGCVVFGAYPLGKAQELIKIMNGIGLVPKVSRSISDLSEVYKRFGVGLEYDRMTKESVHPKSLEDNFVYIIENSKFRECASRISMLYNRKVFTAVATGFAKMFKFNTDVQFPLSDHADFMQALEYLEIAKPKLVYTVGREARVMAKNLNRFGYNATQLNNDTDFCGVEILRIKG